MNPSKVSVDEIDVRGKWGLLQYYDVYLQGLMDRVGLFEVLTSYGLNPLTGSLDRSKSSKRKNVLRELARIKEDPQRIHPLLLITREAQAKYEGRKEQHAHLRPALNG